MANIYLLRHGKVDGEAALYGHTDVPVAQATNEKINQDFAAFCQRKNITIDHMVTSPLIRCLSLAQLIASSRLLAAPKAIDAIKEMNFGQYDGVPFDALHQQPEHWQVLEKFWQDPVQQSLPEAELLTGFSYRVSHAWQQLVEQARQLEQNTLVVCHGGVIRMILAHVLNVDFRNPLWYTQLSIGNGSLTTIEVKENDTRVKHIAKPLDGFSTASEQVA